MNTKNVLIVASTVSLILATLGVSVNSIALVPLGLALFVASHLLK